MMKKLFLITSILAVCSGCHSEQALLEGHIDNYQGEMVTIWSREYDNWADTLQVDASGNFIYTPKNNDALIYALTVNGYEPYENPVYLGKADQVKVNFSLLPDKTMKVQFAGDRAAENEYLQAYTEFENSMMAYQPEMKNLSFMEYKAKVDEKEQELQALLDKVTDVNFKERYAKSQHLLLQNNRLAYSFIFASQVREGKKNSDEDFTAFIKSIDMNDPNQCNEFMAWEIIEWYRVNGGEQTTGNRNMDYFNWLDRLVSNPEMKSVFATDKMEAAIRVSVGESLETEMERYRQLCTNDSLRQQTEAKYQEYVRVYNNLMPGKVAPDFELISDKGETIRLSDLRGQYVFIDVWATWCGGCVMQIPYMEKLQEHFANDKRIKLISISWDYTQDVWLDYLEKRPATWAQYIVDKENMDFMKKEYRMSFIPRFLLLDPEGRIISIDCALPSDPECLEMLEREINKK